MVRTAGILVSGLLIATSACAQDGYGEDGPVTPAGALQGNWRVTRTGDPSDGAVMRLQIIHDGARLEGDYVLFQPFCWIDRPLPQPLGDDCELTGQGGTLQGRVEDGARAWLTLRPGADGLDHVLEFGSGRGHRMAGVYRAPGSDRATAVTLERQPF